MNQLKSCIFNTVFIDIETVSGKNDFSNLSPSMKNLWRSKAIALNRYFDDELSEQNIAELYEEKAAIYAEFGKIVCISMGMFYRNKGQIELVKKSFYGESEESLLEEFLALIKEKFNDSNRYYFCGHNLREFDIPYICRRALIQGLRLPATLEISGKKAWQLHHLVDTLQLWKFGDYKHYTSLALLCEIFGIESPKTDMDGSKVGFTYYQEEDLEKIKEYCENDVEAVAYLFAKMIGRSDIEQERLSSTEILNLDSFVSSIAS